MPTEELRRRYNEGNFGELRPFVEAELTERDLAEKAAADSRAEARADDALSISRKALFISERANTIAHRAMILSIVATIIAAATGLFFAK